MYHQSACMIHLIILYFSIGFLFTGNDLKFFLAKFIQFRDYKTHTSYFCFKYSIKPIYFNKLYFASTEMMPGKR